MMKIALLGITTDIREVLEALIEKGKNFDIGVFTSRPQVGEEIDCVDKIFAVRNVKEVKVQDYDLAVFVGDERLAKEYAHDWVNAGVKVINATEALSDYQEIPWAIAAVPIKECNIVNTIEGLSLPLAKAIYALKDLNIKDVKLTVLSGADIAGQDGMSELYNHTRKILMNEEPADKKVFPKTLAFNVIPQVGGFIGEETEEEWKLAVDIKRILGEKLKIHVNCALVPVFVGLGAFVNIGFAREVTPEEVRNIFNKAKGFLTVDSQKDGGYAALTDVQGEKDIFISRIRQDGGNDKGISFWIAGDARKTAAADLVELIVKMLKKEMK